MSRVRCCRRWRDTTQADKHAPAAAAHSHARAHTHTHAHTHTRTHVLVMRVVLRKSRTLVEELQERRGVSAPLEASRVMGAQHFAGVRVLVEPIAARNVGVLTACVCSVVARASVSLTHPLPHSLTHSHRHVPLAESSAIAAGIAPKDSLLAALQ